MAGIVASALWLGCATSGAGGANAAAAPAPAAEFKPTGEISFAAVGESRGASFDDTRVVGSSVNLSRRPDGSWAGLFRDRPTDVSVYSDRIAGVELKLVRQDTPDGVIITGTHMGNILRFEVLHDKLVVRTPKSSYTLPRVSENAYGTGGAVKFIGEAGSANPPWPQFALALAATF